jgi:hypothetical protein
VQDKNLARIGFPPQWNDVVRDAIVPSFPHGGMMLLEMCLCL